MGSGGVRHWPRPARLCLRGYSLPSRQVSPSAFAPLQPVDSLANERPLAKQTALPGSRPFGADANDAMAYLHFKNLLLLLKATLEVTLPSLISIAYFRRRTEKNGPLLPRLQGQQGPKKSSQPLLFSKPQAKFIKRSQQPTELEYSTEVLKRECIFKQEHS